MTLGLASTSGRTFPNQIEGLISEGAELTMEIVPFLSQFPKHYFLEGEAKKGHSPLNWRLMRKNSYFCPIKLIFKQ